MSHQRRPFGSLGTGGARPSPCRRCALRPARHRLAERSSGTSTGSISRSVGSASRGEQLERPLEAVGVVDERPAHLELVEEHAVRVERRRLDAGADHREAAAAAQLVEAGLHGGLLAGALEHDVDRVGGDALGLPHRVQLEVVGVAAPARRRARRPARRRASPGSTAVTGPMPRATSAAIVSAPIGPAPITMARSPSTDARPGDAVQRDRQRLGQRRLPHRHAVGQARAASARRPAM